MACMFDCCRNGSTFPNNLNGIYDGGRFTFMQTFVLAPRNPKKYYVHKDIFQYRDKVFMKAARDTSTGKTFSGRLSRCSDRGTTPRTLSWAMECLVWSELKPGSVRKVTNFEKIRAKTVKS